MKQSADQIRSLTGLLDSDFAHLDELVAENSRAESRIAQGASDSLDYAALGYTVHNFYSLIENYLMRIAKHFENRLSTGAWHAELLDRMSSEVPGVRPRFFEPAEALPFRELRAFRHVFRNMYRGSLRPERVREVQKLIPGAIVSFRRAHERFRTALLSIADKLD